MGLCLSKNKASYSEIKDPLIFIQKMKLLQKEISAILKEREKEREAYERQMMLLAFKEADWRKEKKQLREEVKRLRKKLEEKEKRVKEMEEEVGSTTARKSEGVSVESGSIASLMIVEQMREERARRDEAVEKWKMLYLAIKHELDDLIQRTHQETLYRRADEKDSREELQRQLKAKDETIQVLKAQIASIEEEDFKNRREVDILRQSLRIVCSKKETATSTTASTPIADTLFS